LFGKEALMPITTVPQGMTDIISQPNPNIVINGEMRINQRQDNVLAHNPPITAVDVNAATTYVVSDGFQGTGNGYIFTQGAITGTYSAYHAVTGLAVGDLVKVSILVKLGTATNFVFHANDALLANTHPSTHTEATIANGFSTTQYKELSFTLTATNTAMDIHMGIFTSETGLPVQTNGTVFLSDLKVLKDNPQGANGYSVDRFTNLVANVSATSVSRMFSYQSIRPSLSNTLASRVEVAAAETSGYPTQDYNHGIRMSLEGYSIAPISKGDLVISFKFMSNVSGVFPVSIRANVQTDSYVHEFNYTTPNVEQTITFVLPASSKFTVSDSSLGCTLVIGFINTGSWSTPTANRDTWVVGNYVTTDACVNWATAIGNYIEVTDVKMEAGNKATPLLSRPYAEELRLCQRYYEMLGSILAGSESTTYSFVTWQYKASKRVMPTVVITPQNAIYGVPTIHQQSDSEFLSVYVPTGRATLAYGTTADAEL